VSTLGENDEVYRSLMHRFYKEWLFSVEAIVFIPIVEWNVKEAKDIDQHFFKEIAPKIFDKKITE
jgi:hypothetical protein